MKNNSLELLKKEKLALYVNPIYYSYLKKIVIFDELSSTNDYLMGLLKRGIKDECIICFAEKQTKGRGRLGKSWVSPYAANIYLSILWNFAKPLKRLSGLSLTIALAAAKAMNDYGITKKLGLKWPNDLFWQDKKLAGILIENLNSSVVIGIGLNVNMPDEEGVKIGQNWIDLARISNSKPSRNKIAGFLLNQFLIVLSIFQEKGFAPFINSWRELDIACNRSVSLNINGERVVGIGRGVDQFGNFLLEKKNAKIVKYAVGEISLRVENERAQDKSP